MKMLAAFIAFIGYFIIRTFILFELSGQVKSEAYSHSLNPLPIRTFTLVYVVIIIINPTAVLREKVLGFISNLEP